MARRKVTRGAPPQLARSSRNKTWPQGSGRTASREKGEGDSANFLGVYFREMSDLDVMSAEQELAAATRIFELRKTYWNAILAYPPFIDGIAAYIESQIEADEVPGKELKAIVKASRSLLR
jgi:RNA polymerase primary sigma factor